MENTMRHPLFDTDHHTDYRADATPPPGAQSLMSPEQSAALRQICAQTSLVPPQVARFHAAKAELSTFYPRVAFVCDAFEDLPNVFAFRAHSKTFVLVTGGMLRLPRFHVEGLMLAMAHGVATVTALSPGQEGRQAKSWLDEVDTLGVMAHWRRMGPPYNGYAAAATRQWSRLANLVHFVPEDLFVAPWSGANVAN